jgi:hypothetical protein
MSMSDKTVLEHRRDIIENLKYFSISEKKWLLRRFWKGVIDSTTLEDKSEIVQKLPPKFINDTKGQILYMSMKLMLDRHIDSLLKEKYPSVKIN